MPAPAMSAPMKTRPARLRPLLLAGVEPRCGDCEHYDEEGCPEAAEALVLEGWPRAAVLPEASAEAGRCPEFSPAEGWGETLAEEDEASQAWARERAIRGYAIW